MCQARVLAAASTADPRCRHHHPRHATRHGVTNLYAALDAASGKVTSQMTARHRAIEFKRFLAATDHHQVDHLLLCRLGHASHLPRPTMPPVPAPARPP